MVRDSKFEMFESMRIYIERNGRPHNYLESIRKLNDEREMKLIAEEEITAKEAAEALHKKEDKSDNKHHEMEEKERIRLEMVMQHIKELDECEDLNMRQFLMKFIVPVLTEGMIEVWKYAPIDPVDYLADYMYKKSNNMK
jgi:adenylate kinase